MSRGQGWVLIGAVDFVVSGTVTPPINQALWAVAGLVATLIGLALVAQEGIRP